MRVRVILFVIAGVILSSGCGGSSSSSVSIPQNSPDITVPAPENEPPTQSHDITEPTPSPENESQDTNPSPEIVTPSPSADITIQTQSFDFDTGTVTLNSGVIMPILGIGTYSLTSSQAENSVYWALKAGFRLIDTARIYGNEDGVGRGIQRAIDEGIVTRGEIFVTTKMWTSDYSNGAQAIDSSLQRLVIDYVYLMILHHSQPANDVAAYKSMEEALSAGKLRAVGLSNYYTPEDFDRLANSVTIHPAILQNETHMSTESFLPRKN